MGRACHARPKLFLLALAEVSADMGTTCDFMTASWSMLVELTGLDENTLGQDAHAGVQDAEHGGGAVVSPSASSRSSSVS